VAKLKITDGEGLGTYLTRMVHDPAERAEFEKDPKGKIRQFTELLDPKKTWDQVTVKTHFDEEFVINLIIPWYGDIDQTREEIAPPQGTGSPYNYPDYCTPGTPGYIDPKGGQTDDEKKSSRMKAYYFRLSDYIMTRCK